MRNTALDEKQFFDYVFKTCNMRMVRMTNFQSPYVCQSKEISLQFLGMLESFPSFRRAMILAFRNASESYWRQCNHRRSQGRQWGHGPLKSFRTYSNVVLWDAFFQTKWCFSAKIKHFGSSQIFRLATPLKTITEHTHEPCKNTVTKMFYLFDKDIV